MAMRFTFKFTAACLICALLTVTRTPGAEGADLNLFREVKTVQEKWAWMNAPDHELDESAPEFMRNWVAEYEHAEDEDDFADLPLGMLFQSNGFVRGVKMLQMVAKREHLDAAKNEREEWFVEANSLDCDAHREGLATWLQEFVASEENMRRMKKDRNLGVMAELFQNDFQGFAVKALALRKIQFHGVEIPTTEDLTARLSKGIRIVEFYEEWCMACLQTAPKYDGLVVHYEATPLVSVERFNCGEGFIECNSRKIYGFPTIKMFFYGNEVTKYMPGSYDTDKLVKWVDPYVQMALEQVANKEASEKQAAREARRNKRRSKKKRKRNRGGVDKQDL